MGMKLTPKYAPHSMVSDNVLFSLMLEVPGMALGIEVRPYSDSYIIEFAFLLWHFYWEISKNEGVNPSEDQTSIEQPTNADEVVQH